MRYCLGPPDSFGPIWTALGFMPFGLFFDFMDGKVARWRGKSSLMGQELDSLADLVCQACMAMILIYRNVLHIFFPWGGEIEHLHVTKNRPLSFYILVSASMKAHTRLRCSRPVFSKANTVCSSGDRFPSACPLLYAHLRSAYEPNLTLYFYHFSFSAA